MRKTLTLTIIFLTCACISQMSPHFEECSPSDADVSVASDESVTFSCAATDPDTTELSYTWFLNGEKVAESPSYTLPGTEGVFTLVLEVSDGKTTISHPWNVTVIPTPDFDKIKDRVERIRNLSFLKPVERMEIDRAQLKENIVEDLEGDTEDIETEQKLFVALHVLAPDDDLSQLYTDIFTSQVASYYDTKSHTFYEVVDPDSPIVYREFIAAHELIHALQDQYQYLDYTYENDDGELAALCVVEGDATFHQYMYLDQMTNTERKTLFDYVNSLDIPAVNTFLESVIMIPYDAGLQFFALMRFSGIESLYQNLPVSTEQVLHPEKYLSHEMPVEVTVPSIPSWESLTENTLGEAVLKTILQQHMDTEKAADAAEGWGGDKYSYAEKEGEYVLIINTFWDTKADATEFSTAYYDFSAKWSKENLKKISGNVYETPSGFLALVQREKNVLVVESSSLEAVNEVLAAVGSCVFLLA